VRDGSCAREGCVRVRGCIKNASVHAQWNISHVSITHTPLSYGARQYMSVFVRLWMWERERERERDRELMCVFVSVWDIVPFYGYAYISWFTIDWFWLRGWLINKGAICTRTAPLFWIFISLFQSPRTRLIRKIGSQNQSIVTALNWLNSTPLYYSDDSNIPTLMWRHVYILRGIYGTLRNYSHYLTLLFGWLEFADIYVYACLYYARHIWYTS